MEQVIINLAINAGDAMPEGGKLTITTENKILGEDQCRHIPKSRPGKYVCLTVEDAGTGMAEDTVQQIFDPFFTTKAAGKGTGLGLSVVYGIVQNHNGWINVSSVPGKGAAFKVYLSSFTEKPENEKEETVSERKLQGRRERVLLVEEEDLRKVTARLLRENGYSVKEAANAEEAMNLFEAEKEEFQLVFSDVVLTGKDGLSLEDQLLVRKPGLPVLLCSGYTATNPIGPLSRKRGFGFCKNLTSSPFYFRPSEKRWRGKIEYFTKENRGAIKKTG